MLNYIVGLPVLAIGTAAVFCSNGIARAVFKKEEKALEKTSIYIKLAGFLIALAGMLITIEIIKL